MNNKERVESIVDQLGKHVELLKEKLEQGADIESHSFYSTVYSNLKHAENLIRTVEEMDENLDVEKTNLPAVDELLGEDTVSDYINAKIDYLSGNNKEEAEKKMIRAAKAIEAEQETANPPKENKENITYSEHLKRYGIHDLTDRIVKFQQQENEWFVEKIEEYLDSKAEIEEKDLDLIRFFLLYQPDNSFYDVLELSDGALEVAWRTHKYLKNKDTDTAMKLIIAEVKEACSKAFK